MESYILLFSIKFILCFRKIIKNFLKIIIIIKRFIFLILLWPLIFKLIEPVLFTEIDCTCRFSGCQLFFGMPNIDKYDNHKYVQKLYLLVYRFPKFQISKPKQKTNKKSRTNKFNTFTDGKFISYVHIPVLKMYLWNIGNLI